MTRKASSSPSRSFLRPAVLLVLACASLLTACKKSPAPPLRNQPLYDESANPAVQIHDALAQAAAQHKRVILVFGGNWCGDCLVLDYYFHQPPNASLLNRNFVLVNIDIGHMDHNLDIAAKYDVPVQRGVPALAVLASNGQLIYSQDHGGFDIQLRNDPSAVTQFLEQWKSSNT